MNAALRSLLEAAALAVVYFAAAKATLMFAIPPGYASAVWPASGIALAALWLRGPRLWPGVALGAVAAIYSIDASLVAALAIGAGHTLEALAAAWLMRRFLADRRGPFSRPVQVFRFFAIALGAAVVGATVGAGSLTLAGLVTPAQAAANWLTWWMGGASGIVVVAPLIWAFARPSPLRRTPAGVAELVLLAGLFAMATGEVFGGWLFGSPSLLPLTFALVPFVIWAAIRFAEREVLALCALSSAIAVIETFSGSGPFAGRPPDESLLLQRAFAAILVATGLVLLSLVLEQRRLSETLRRANAELEEMIQLAARELQEPLRSHLLEVAEAGRRPLVLERLDSAAVLEGALDGLKGALEASGAVVSHERLPRVCADRRMLHSVFQNLVSNAIKYRSEAPPRIEVSARRGGNAWLFSVRDNGKGIDPKHRDAVFRIFERLGNEAGRDKGQGKGIGLALSRKLIERHGGRMWLESAAAQGATFYFSIPLEEAHDDAGGA